MPHIIRDAEFKTCTGDGLWPGMWVYNHMWNHPRAEVHPLDVCYLWIVEQHDQVMMLVGQGVDVILPLTEELAEGCVIFKPPHGLSLADYPEEWAALRNLGWGVRLCYGSNGYTTTLYCQRANRNEFFSLSRKEVDKARANSEVMRSLLRTAWWRLKHPKYAQALRTQQPASFWRWPNTPSLKQLHQMGREAWKTAEGKVEIGPDGTLKATGRKAWDFPTNEE